MEQAEILRQLLKEIEELLDMLHTGYPEAPIFLIGFLGAFTTFSTLALESTNMLLAGEYGRAALNLLIQNVSGVAAVFCGICAGRLI